jgi:acetyl esterase
MMPLHPEVSALIASLGQWQRENGVPARSAGNFPEQRHWGRVMFPLKKTIEERPGISVEKSAIPTRGGERPVRIYRPEGGATLPTLIFVHGGGYAVGGLDDVHHEALRLAASLPANVVSISYRLAPEDPWPAAIDDGEDIVEAVAAGVIGGVASTGLGFGGISAGAGLVAAVTQRLLAKGNSPVSVLFLMSPWLDMTQTLPSTHLFGSGYFLERSTLDLFIEAYRGKSGSVDHPELSPARHALPKNWPATILLSAECDPLADDAAIFARRLAEADIPYVWRVARGMMHAFHGWVGQLPSGADDTAWMDARLRDWYRNGAF